VRSWANFQKANRAAASEKSVKTLAKVARLLVWHFVLAAGLKLYGIGLL
jgi:hypothetical protein